MPLLTTLHSPGQHYNNGGAQLTIVTELAQQNLLQLLVQVHYIVYSI